MCATTGWNNKNITYFTIKQFKARIAKREAKVITVLNSDYIHDGGAEV